MAISELLCSVCAKNEAKYKCPGCASRTCSLECCRTHKQHEGCLGTKQKASYVPLSSFEERQLLSDVSFLEEVQRAQEQAGRERPSGGSLWLSKPFRLLILEARRRGVQLIPAPRGLTISKRNTSYYNVRAACIHWRVEWKFPCQQEVLVTRGTLEGDTIGSALQQLFKNAQKHGKLTHPLQEYVAAGPGALTLLLRHERSPANKPTFLRLDPERTWAEELRGRIVREFPTVHVLLPSQAKEYNIVDSKVPQHTTTSVVPTKPGKPVVRDPRTPVHVDPGGQRPEPSSS
eukprot:jgi/Botrbrau1/4385/Bobra.105_2s0031.1